MDAVAQILLLGVRFHAPIGLDDPPNRRQVALAIVRVKRETMDRQPVAYRCAGRQLVLPVALRARAGGEHLDTMTGGLKRLADGPQRRFGAADDLGAEAERDDGDAPAPLSPPRERGWDRFGLPSPL